MASEGTSLLPVANQDALSDRISLPLGLAARPFAHLASINAQSSWLQRFVASLGVQVGLSMEHLRTSTDDCEDPRVGAGELSYGDRGGCSRSDPGQVVGRDERGGPPRLGIGQHRRRLVAL